MRMNTHSKAASLGFPYVDKDNGRESSDGLTWLIHFCKDADYSDSGIYVGWNQTFHCWVIEQPE